MVVLDDNRIDLLDLDRLTPSSDDLPVLDRMVLAGPEPEPDISRRRTSDSEDMTRTVVVVQCFPCVTDTLPVEQIGDGAEDLRGLVVFLKASEDDRRLVLSIVAADLPSL